MLKNILSLSYLQGLYKSAESVDSPIFAEMRSNIRLVAGDHFLKGVHKDLARTKYSRRVSQEMKLRLTQNHISRASNIWVNSMVQSAPDVEVLPNNEYEEKDKKAAQLNSLAKDYIGRHNDIEELIRDLAKDYWDIGEAIVKVSFNPEEGPEVLGPIEQQFNPETLQVELVQEEFPAGLIKFEKIFGFNLLRDPSAQSWDQCRYMIHRKMMDKDVLLAMFPGDENQEVRAKIQTTNEDTFKVYNASSNSYGQTNKVLLQEYYFKPNKTMPKGYFVICTSNTILFHGKLPFGIFPFEVVNFDNVQTTPRGRSKIKQLRPIQAEINRAVSKIAEHQVTLGDDKLILNAGSKIAESNKISGVRALQVSGTINPTIMEGRSGSQYVEYWLNQVAMFEKIAEIPEIEQDRLAQLDAYSILYLSMRQKQKFSFYSSKFENFIVRMWKKALKLYKLSVDPVAVSRVLGAQEEINVDEFKSLEDISFQVKVKPRSDDPESLIARQFQINQIMQYKGSDLSDVDFGELISDSPFFGKKALLSSGKLKADRATNMILKLDKGVDMPISEVDDADYMLTRIDKRMSESDFDVVTFKNREGQIVPNEHIKQLYEQKRQEYLALIEERLKKQQMMQAGQIPSSGDLIPVQMYSTEAKADGGFKVVREYFPYDSLKWLKDSLLNQGMTQETISGFSPNSQEDINESLAQPSQMPDEGQIY